MEYSERQRGEGGTTYTEEGRCGWRWCTVRGRGGRRIQRTVKNKDAGGGGVQFGFRCPVRVTKTLHASLTGLRRVHGDRTDQGPLVDTDTVRLVSKVRVLTAEGDGPDGWLPSSDRAGYDVSLFYGLRLRGVHGYHRTGTGGICK